jgi:cytochrome P450
VAIYASANRDESLYPQLNEFRPDRDNLKEHLAFGKGIHLCLGAALSRLEGRVALRELVRRVATIRLTDDNEYRYFPSFMLRGLTSLHAELTADEEASA